MYWINEKLFGIIALVLLGIVALAILKGDAKEIILTIVGAIGGWIGNSVSRQSQRSSDLPKGVKDAAA